MASVIDDELRVSVSSTDEAELMQAVAQGDKTAFTTIVNAHVDALYHYAWRISQSRSQAEDLVQETWLQVWRKAHSFNARKASLSTWLHRILHNKFIDTTRRFRQTTELDSGSIPSLNPYTMTAAHEPTEESSTTEPDPASSLVQARTKLILDQALSELPHAQRSALILSQVHGFSSRDVAHIMNKNPRAIESLIARARQTLRSRMAERLHHENSQLSTKI